MTNTSGISIGRFILTYLCLLAVFMFIAAYSPLHRFIEINDSYSGFIVYLVSGVMERTGISSTFQGGIINLPNISLDVKYGCNGLEAVMLYSAAVIAFPAPWKKKAAGVAAGLLFIQIFNVLRIAGLAYAGVHFKKYFDVLHIYVAQGMTIVVSLVIFITYLHYVGKSGKSV
ncbi:MAG: archaeosortase/exosortase family protein [Dissulfurispiraceae bacterium]